MQGIALSGDEVVLNIVGPKRPLNKNLLGFNQSAPPLQEVGFKEFFSLSAVNDLNMEFYRFPGGTNSNFYRWDLDHFVPSDLDDYKALNTERTRKGFEKFGPGGNMIGFKDCMDWMRTHAVQCSFVLNLSTDPDLNNALNVLKQARNDGIAVKYLELGNELYYPEQGGSKFKNPVSYTDLIAASIPKIKQDFPEAKCGVATWGTLFNDKMMPWDVELAKKQYLFDALSIHLYLDTDIIPEKYIGSAAFNYTESGFHDLLNAYRTTFPNKAIWITEWNISNKGQEINKSLYGTIFAADFFINLIKQQDVDFANYHALLGRSHSLLDAYWHYKSKPFYVEKALPYYFWILMGKVFRISDIFIEPTIVSAAEPQAINSMYFAGQGQETLLITNRSDRQKVVRLSGHDDLILMNTAITGQSLDFNLKDNGYKFAYKTGQHRSFVSVEPNSINFITLQAK